MASQDAVDQIIEKYGREENKDEKHPLVKTVVCRLSALCTVPVSPMGRIFLSESPTYVLVRTTKHETQFKKS